MGNELFQARLPDEFAEKIHEYRENNHMTKSEAVRHLIRTGLEAEAEADDDEGDTWFLERLAQDSVFIPAVVIGLFGILLPYPAILAFQTGQVLWAVVFLTAALMFMIGGTIVAVASLLAQFALRRPLRGLAPFREVTADE